MSSAQRPQFRNCPPTVGRAGGDNTVVNGRKHNLRTCAKNGPKGNEQSVAKHCQGVPTNGLCPYNPLGTYACSPQGLTIQTIIPVPKMAATLSTSDYPDTHKCTGCNEAFGNMPGCTCVGNACGHIKCAKCTQSDTLSDATAMCTACFPPKPAIPSQANTTAIADFIDEHKDKRAAEASGTPRVYCEECEKLGGEPTEATEFCDGCPEITPLCEDHGRIHRKKGHCTRLRFPFSCISLECPTHAKNEYNFLCFTCHVGGRPLCGLCESDEHKRLGHSIVRIAEGKPRQKALVETDKAQLVVNEKLFQAVHDDGEKARSSMSSQYRTAIAELRAAEKRFLDAIHARIAQLETQFSKVHAEKDDKQREQVQAAISSRNLFRLGIDMADGAVASANPITMRSTIDALSVMKCACLTTQPPLAVPPVLKLDASKMDSVLEAINSFGALITK